jgi:hypothetical protein
MAEQKGILHLGADAHRTTWTISVSKAEQARADLNKPIATGFR